jgi:gamma-glutamylputrescine oxidase
METLFPAAEGRRHLPCLGRIARHHDDAPAHVARVGTNILSGAGFSGHGVALSGMAGRVMAEAVLGQEDGLTTFETLPVPRFPGGTVFRAPLLTLAMTWYACATASASDAGKPRFPRKTFPGHDCSMTFVAQAGFPRATG